MTIRNNSLTLPYLICGVLLISGRPAHADDPLVAEAQARTDKLIQEGFNLTYGLRVGRAGREIELLVAPSDDAHELSLWFAAQGEAEVRVISPDGEAFAGWNGIRGEQRLSRRLAPGRYVVRVTGAAGRGLIGLKGPALSRCRTDRMPLQERSARPQDGFHWPYVLYGQHSDDPRPPLVVPINVGFATEDLDLLRAAATCQVTRRRGLASTLDVPLLIPLFPRPSAPAPEGNLYLHALSRSALASTDPRLARVDRQLLAMVDDAAKAIGPLLPRMLITGFSAAGMFANRFAVLHPNRVLAAAVGAPGGWPIAPIADDELVYPVGIADLERLAGRSVDLEALARVHFFFFQGADDDNDSVPYRDSYPPEAERLIVRRFGKTPVERWPVAERMYRDAGLKAVFRLYPDVGHEWTEAMETDVLATFLHALKRKR